ncbi:SusC/RagA family TonB-linked outer membrane protein [Cognatitamlana onchidii]|uniref:SusC/RagA family TonB-linked outer membrane protein n=1 Tax=Cognatitamlana onchidii TaxID=2562860 RepID=UPI0010A6B47E|nr:TonB-dependent receptor [Algibacter onchidii]
MKKLKFVLGVFYLLAISAFGFSPNELTLDAENHVESEKIEVPDEIQAIEISGVVSDVDGPLPGVNIVVKGTTTGTQTDFDGNYAISVSGSNPVLVFSYVGYKTQEIPVGAQKTINVLLEQDVAGLDEVVVVGYSTRKRGELTGSVSTVSAKEIENTSNTEVAKSLAGRASGVIINDRGGYPGSNNVDILIRGQSTLNNNNPLILIDGIQSGTAVFNQLAPQDIESLSILKDGAAAIYGTRAANGVIIVTTKRGKSGRPKLQLSTSYSLSSFSVTPDLMTSAEWATYENEIAERISAPLPFTEEDIEKYRSGEDPLNYPNTDWADLTFANTVPETRNSLSISGATENVGYFVSGDFMSREGVFDSGDLNFNQTQVRSNIDVKLNNDIKVSVDLSGRFSQQNQPGVDAGFIYKHIYTNFPNEIGVYPNGLPAFGGENGANPVIMSSNQSGFVENNYTNLRGRLALDWKLDAITEGLSFNGFVGLRRGSGNIKNFYTPWTWYRFNETTGEYDENIGFSQRGKDRILNENFNKFNQELFNATFRYNRTFGNHSINGLIGYELTTGESEFFEVQRNSLPSPSRPYLFAADGEDIVTAGGAAENALISYFGNVVYDYNKKYILELTLRRDGSSNFPPGKQFDNFYSIGGTWAIGKESFLEDVSWLSSLNLRGSYSKMGNDRIPPFQFLTRYNYNSDPTVPGQNVRPNYYHFGEVGAYFAGYSSSVTPNPNITWEKAFMKNIGLSFSLFDSKFTGDINYFSQRREDILEDRGNEVAAFTGIIFPDENVGVVDSYGFELSLGWAEQINNNFRYNLGFNFTQAKSEVVGLPEPANVTPSMSRVGKPVRSYVVYPTAGVFPDQATVDATDVKLENTVEGEIHYLDTDDNGVIGAGDRVRTSTSNIPEIQYGFSGGLNYKEWNFSFLWVGQAEAQVLVFFDQQGSKPSYVFDQRWTPDNRNSRYPRAFGLNDTFSGNQNSNPDNFQGADTWLHDASFLRLKEVELGYTIPRDITRFADMKIFARGLNLLTLFSDVYDLGLDPEATGYNNFRNATYPSLTMFTFGLNMTF